MSAGERKSRWGNDYRELGMAPVFEPVHLSQPALCPGGCKVAMLLENTGWHIVKGLAWQSAKTQDRDNRRAPLRAWPS